MSRTAEKVLAIISAVLTTIGIVMNFVGMFFYYNLKSDPLVQSEFEAELLSDPTLTQAEIDMMYNFFAAVDGFMWFIIIGLVIGLIISLILTIVGIVSIWDNKKPKLAGTMFIIAGLLAGIISLPSILLYIAGILCFVKKQKLEDQSPFVDDQQGGTMRPL